MTHAAAGRSPRGEGLIRTLRSVVVGLIVGVTAIVFAISFAAVIWSGPLAQYLSQGIGLTLIGASAMAVVGVWRLSYPGTIVQPQDVTAVLVATAAGSIAAEWEPGRPGSLIATVAALVAATTAVTGVAAWSIGRLRLGFVARFIPYPVLGGFLVATGYLLTLGAVGMALGTGVSLWTLPVLLEPGNPARWMPWIAIGIGLAVLTRRVRHGLVLPAAIAAITALFYAVLWASGTSLATAQAEGLLLGPFQEGGFLRGIGPHLVADADWPRVLAEVPTMAAVAGLAIMGALLYASALEIATGQRIDPDRDLRGVGLANLAAATGGGMVGYHLLSQTLFARALGMTGRLCGVAVAVVSLFTVFYGANFLSVLPVGVFASVIAFLGVDLLYDWLWVARRRLPGRDFAVVLVILTVAATVGFLQAVAAGLLVAALLFVVAYARVDAVRLRASLASLRSRVERPDAALVRLAQVGDRAQVWQLRGYLFFGTASRLADEIGPSLASGPGLRFVLIDFAQVHGMDASAAFALHRLVSAADGPVRILTSLSPSLADALARVGLVEGPGLRILARLDDALREVEEALLDGSEDKSDEGFLEALEQLHPGFDPKAAFERRAVARGAEVIREGDVADGMILLLEGRLAAEAAGEEGDKVPIATILPGTLAGEIAHYAGVTRTARVVAEEDCVLLVVTEAALARVARDAPAVVADFHRLAAAHLARRLMRTTALLRSTDR